MIYYSIFQVRVAARAMAASSALYYISRYMFTLFTYSYYVNYF